MGAIDILSKEQRRSERYSMAQLNIFHEWRGVYGKGHEISTLLHPQLLYEGLRLPLFLRLSTFRWCCSEHRSNTNRAVKEFSHFPAPHGRRSLFEETFVHACPLSRATYMSRARSHSYNIKATTYALWYTAQPKFGASYLFKNHFFFYSASESWRNFEVCDENSPPSGYWNGGDNVESARTTRACRCTTPISRPPDPLSANT